VSAQTNIEWCDSTFNPWIGCARVSPACDDCYAARSTPVRTLGLAWGPGTERRRTSAENWKQPLRWNAAAAEFQATHGRRRRVFCASLADVFDNEVDRAWRADLFDLIRMTPALDWLLLTKRVGNAWKLMADACGVSQASLKLPLPNVWLGATVVTQAEADRDIPKLLNTPAAKRFLSVEPMLGPISFEGLFANTHRINDGTNALETLDWVICGGESGPKARPMHPDWARSLRDQCAAAGVPFLFKQWGEWAPGRQHAKRDLGTWMTPSGRLEAWAGGLPRDRSEVSTLIYCVGKKVAGRLLDGRTHDEFPESTR
jgi:protein gp37